MCRSQCRVISLMSGFVSRTKKRGTSLCGPSASRFGLLSCYFRFAQILNFKWRFLELCWSEHIDVAPHFEAAVGSFKMGATTIPSDQHSSRTRRLTWGRSYATGCPSENGHVVHVATFKRLYILEHVSDFAKNDMDRKSAQRSFDPCRF